MCVTHCEPDMFQPGMERELEYSAQVEYSYLIITQVRLTVLGCI